MNPFSRKAAFLLATIVATCLLLPRFADAQGSKIYLNPDFTLGLTSGYNNGLDPGSPNTAVRLELRGGYKLNAGLSLFTGFGYSSYHYRLVAAAMVSGPDTIRDEQQIYYEVPMGVRVATFYGRRSFRTRYYAAAGLRACFLTDSRHDYKTVDGVAAESNVVRPEDFNKFWIRMFAEGGLDIPMDYDSAILIGLSVSNGLTRNMNTDGALSRENYGVLVVGASIGLRFGL